MTNHAALLGTTAMALALLAAYPASSQDTGAAAQVEEVVVTANKIEQRISDVGMSVQAATGAELNKLGVTDTEDLNKIAPGFTFRQSGSGTPVYTIRGVGFQDSALAASPTVSVYLDEVPLPFSILSTGASMDLARVEVLKGPQGTLFGSNATGGAVNYIAAIPTREFAAGVDASYGRFNTLDLQGFVGGPLTDNLAFRVAARNLSSGPWQSNYVRPDQIGEQALFQGRAMLAWEPTARFSTRLTLTGFVDRGDSQIPQFVGVANLNPTSAADPRIIAYPRAPQDARAADWSACANVSAFNEPYDSTPIGAVRPTTAINCASQDKDNRYFSVSLRSTLDLTDGLTLTSLSSFQTFDRRQVLETDGTAFQVHESVQQGDIDVWYQELRIAGDFGGDGNWVIGGNYQRDKTFDHFLHAYGNSTTSPFRFPAAALCDNPATPQIEGYNCAGVDLAGVPILYELPLGPTVNYNHQTTDTWAIFASGAYPILDRLTLELGARYTSMKKDFAGCGADGGDGTWADISRLLQDYQLLASGQITIDQFLAPGNMSGGPGRNVGAGGCPIIGPAPQFLPGLVVENLDEDNVSWRLGLNWKPDERTLVYANVSKGYKAGSFPTAASSTAIQYRPATQESILAYEIGAKTRLLDNTLQLNGSVFYYDYEDKQLLGSFLEPAFGVLGRLVNVPKSHVVGFEVSGVWEPVEGLRVAPAASYSKSEVDGCGGDTAASPVADSCVDGRYYNIDPFGALIDLTGQAFPSAPKWQANIDVQYEWPLRNGATAFVGANLNYLDGAPGAFRNVAPPLGGQPTNALDTPERTLLDLRAGLERDAWRLQLWARNVTDEYYWTSAHRSADVLTRYAGQPATYGVTFSYRFD